MHAHTQVADHMLAERRSYHAMAERLAYEEVARRGASMGAGRSAPRRSDTGAAATRAAAASEHAAAHANSDAAGRGTVCGAVRGVGHGTDDMQEMHPLERSGAFTRLPTAKAGRGELFLPRLTSLPA